VGNAGAGAQERWDANGHFYEVIEDLVSFNTALLKAEQATYLGRKGHLVTITSAEENAFITARTSPTTTYWIAVNGSSSSGTWRYSAGPEKGQLVAYTNWEPSQPDEPAESYVVIAFGKWRDRAISGSNGYIIEYECPPNPEADGYCARMS
jgi:hypothetical protein